MITKQIKSIRNNDISHQDYHLISHFLLLPAFEAFDGFFALLDGFGIPLVSELMKGSYLAQSRRIMNRNFSTLPNFFIKIVIKPVPSPR